MKFRKLSDYCPKYQSSPTLRHLRFPQISQDHMEHVPLFGKLGESEILQQGDSQVSEPCHNKPVNGVAQWAGGWRTGAPFFWSAHNRSFL